MDVAPTQPPRFVTACVRIQQPLLSSTKHRDFLKDSTIVPLGNNASAPKKAASSMAPGVTFSPASSDVEAIPSSSKRGAEAPQQLPRLVPRNLPFHQSKNKMEVEHNLGMKLLWKLVRYDLFHVLLRMPLYQSAFLLFSLWTVFILIFAAIYVAIDRQDPFTPCGLGPVGSPIKFYGAFAFSLETCKFDS
jgi:hypothetical protein